MLDRSVTPSSRCPGVLCLPSWILRARRRAIAIVDDLGRAVDYRLWSSVDVAQQCLDLSRGSHIDRHMELARLAWAVVDPGRIRATMGIPVCY